MKQTVEEQILSSLLKGRTLTSLDAVRDFDTPRFPAYIHSIQKKWNVAIVSKRKKARLVDGRTVHYVEYYISNRLLFKIYQEFYERGKYACGCSKVIGIALDIGCKTLKGKTYE